MFPDIICKVAVLVFLMLAAAPSAAVSGGGNFQSNLLNAKRGQKVASQWTLADWLAQKRQMRMADHWLAMNRSATIFESIASGGHGRYKIKTKDVGGVTTEVDRESQVYALDLYLTIFNLYGEFEKTSDERESLAAAAGVRLFGTSSQTTSLAVRYGWRKLSHLRDGENWENQFAEGLLQLYLIGSFGLNGKYRYYLPNESNLGSRLEGSRGAAGAFVEFMIFRVFAEYYREPLRISSGGQTTEETREGYEAGLKLYF